MCSSDLKLLTAAKQTPSSSSLSSHSSSSPLPALSPPPSPGKKLGFTFDNGKFHNVSLGQGQEVVAEAALDLAAVEGHWVILQVHTHTRGHSTVHLKPLTCSM